MLSNKTVMREPFDEVAKEHEPGLVQVDTMIPQVVNLVENDDIESEDCNSPTKTSLDITSCFCFIQGCMVSQCRQVIMNL